MSALPADLLPRPGGGGALPWLVGAAAFLMALAAAAAFALGRAGDMLATGAADHVTIAIAEADPGRREAAAIRALAVVRAFPGTVAARRIGQDEVARLVSPYLGASEAARLPLPALIDATLRPGADPARLRAALAPLATARVEAEGAALAPLARLIGALRGLALVILVLAGGLAAVVAMLVARAALAGHAATVAVLHELGATDRQLARLVERRTALDALVGGTAGLVLGTAIILALAARVAALDGGAARAGALPTADWGLLAFLPLGLSGLALLAARVAVHRQLRRDL